MAAPFSLATTPGDTDIVSQFPALDRGDKAIIQSWILSDHNVDGSHSQATFVAVGTLLSDGVTTTVAPTPSASRTAVYRDTDGALKTKRGEDSTVEFLGGVPPGFVGHTASATIPNGWLLCDGSAVSRTTYARLFLAIGVLYGAGDGSTTFNLPPMGGRTIVGKDNASRITVAGGNFDASVIATVGGAQNQSIANSHLPASIPYSDAGHTHSYTAHTNTGNFGSGGAFTYLDTLPGSLSGTSGTTVISSLTINPGSAHTALPTVQPSIVLNPIIRT